MYRRRLRSPCLALAILATGCAGPSAQRTSVESPPKPAVAAPTVPPPPEPIVCAIADGLPRLEPHLVPNQSVDVSPDNLRSSVDTLANPALNGRAAGSTDNRRVAQWIAKTFAAFGLSRTDDGDHCVPFERGGIRDQNVVGHLRRGSSSSTPVVLVGAHYDAQGITDGQVHPGADDNASGVAVLLEVARLSTQRKTGPDMVFVAFGAEEVGLLGSKAYVDAPSIPLARISLMLNLDMVGRPMFDRSPLRLLIPNADETLGFVVGARNHAETKALLDRAANRENRPLIGIPESLLTRLGFGSDSVPFSPHMPTIFLSTGDHADYHQPTDTKEKISVDQMTRTTHLALAIVDEVARNQPSISDETKPR